MNKKQKIVVAFVVVVVVLTAGHFGVQYFEAKQREEHFAPHFYEITTWPTSVPLSKDVALNWTLADLIDHGSELRNKTIAPPRPGGIDFSDIGESILEEYSKKTSENGKYVELIIRIDNLNTEEHSWRDKLYSIQLTDERGRKFRPLAVDKDFMSKPPFKGVPDDLGSSIRPGIPREFSAVFEVAKDSTTFTLNLESKERF